MHSANGALCTLHIYGIIVFPQYCQQIFIASELFSGSSSRSRKIPDYNRFVRKWRRIQLKIYSFFCNVIAAAAPVRKNTKERRKVQVNEHVLHSQAFFCHIVHSKLFCFSLGLSKWVRNRFLQKNLFNFVGVCSGAFFPLCSLSTSLQHSFTSNMLLSVSVTKWQK